MKGLLAYALIILLLIKCAAERTSIPCDHETDDGQPLERCSLP